jgi:hypothetical protein
MYWMYKMASTDSKVLAEPKASLYVGCSSWRYWDWRDSFYAGAPQHDWFKHYLNNHLGLFSEELDKSGRQLGGSSRQVGQARLAADSVGLPAGVEALA